MASKQLGTRIKKWLEEEGLQVQLSSPKTHEFVISVSDAYGIGMKFAVFQPIKKNIVLLHTALSMPKEVTDIMKKLDVGSKAKITQSMHRSLLSMVQDHHIGANLDSITLTERVFTENFSRQKFYESLIRIRNTTLYLISVLRGHFAQMGPAQPSTPSHDMYK